MIEPLSNRLEAYIIDWFSLHSSKFELIDEDPFEEGEEWYQQWRTSFEKTGKMQIWTGASSSSIHSSALVNIYARAWHDWTHYCNNWDFTPVQETNVCHAQQAELPEDWYFEKQLLEADIIGQLQYLEENGEFPEDQRAFTMKYLQQPNLITQ